jgi:hypothetical protein
MSSGGQQLHAGGRSLNRRPSRCFMVRCRPGAASSISKPTRVRNWSARERSQAITAITARAVAFGFDLQADLPTPPTPSRRRQQVLRRHLGLPRRRDGNGLRHGLLRSVCLGTGHGDPRRLQRRLLACCPVTRHRGHHSDTTLRCAGPSKIRTPESSTSRSATGVPYRSATTSYAFCASGSQFIVTTRRRSFEQR